MKRNLLPSLTKAVVLCLCLIIGPALLAAGGQKKQKSEPAPEVAKSAEQQARAADEYVIGTDDVLAINVWKEPELTRTVPVRPDGMITLPLVGDIKASGSTPRQLQETIKKQIASYVPNAEVTVSVQEVKSLKFNIVGQVNKPGSYPLIKPMTVLDGIAQAGGFKDFAKTKKIYVLRTDASGKQLKLPFNYNEVIKGGQMGQNVELESRDTIVVP